VSVGPFKPSAILEALERHRVQYVVIGEAPHVSTGGLASQKIST